MWWALAGQAASNPKVQKGAKTVVIVVTVASILATVLILWAIWPRKWHVKEQIKTKPENEQGK